MQRTRTSTTCRRCSRPWHPLFQEIKYPATMKNMLIPASLATLLALTGCRQTPSVTPQYHDIVDAVFASGSTQAKEQYRITAYADGYLQQSFVAEDDSVHKGRLLFRIANELQRTQVENA